MDRVNPPLERRFFAARDGAEAEHYVAIARGFKDVAEFRAYRQAQETRNVADLERRIRVLELSEVR
jgi:hypothetical protein